MYNVYLQPPARAAHTLALLILLVAGMVQASSVEAAPTTAKASKPHTSVSSDGLIPLSNDTDMHRGDREGYVLPNRGTGTVVNGGTGTVVAPKVAPAVPLGRQVGTESVIGNDDRYQILSTTTFPYRAIAHITSNSGGCTGWLIGPDTVATAGHCVYGVSGWATNVRVFPGRNGSTIPFGSCGATRLFSVYGWTHDRNRDYDYGAIKLDCKVGYSTGWFGYHWQAMDLTGQVTSLAGYPADKLYATLWQHDDQLRQTDKRAVYYANDTAPGESGAPVWTEPYPFSWTPRIAYNSDHEVARWQHAKYTRVSSSSKR